MQINSRLCWCLVIVAMLIGTPLCASEYLGAVATESGVPITGQEDIVIFNFTGPVQGCSTAGGTPICTAVIFDNVTLTVNGTDTLNLGNIGPGSTETYTLSGGTYGDGLVTSLKLAATLSTTSLTDDLGNTFSVDANILLDGLPVDGTYAAIAASPASTTIPEPAYMPMVSLLALCGATATRARWQHRRHSALS